MATAPHAVGETNRYDDNVRYCATILAPASAVSCSISSSASSRSSCASRKTFGARRSNTGRRRRWRAIYCWSAAFRSIRRNRCCAESAVRLVPISHICPMAKSATADIGSTASPIGFSTAILRSKRCAGRPPMRTASRVGGPWGCTASSSSASGSASRRCASAIRAGGSATRKTQSARISSSANCRRKASFRRACGFKFVCR